MLAWAMSRSLSSERAKKEEKMRVEGILIKKDKKGKLTAGRRKTEPPKTQIEKEKQNKILADQKAQAEAEAMKERKKAEIERGRIKAEAKQAKEIQQAELEAERKEWEKIQAKLDEQIECPFCHRKFTLTFEKGHEK